jgi:NADH dehydrogenase FAD-containing subunit
MSAPLSIVLVGGGLCHSVAVKVIHTYLLKEHSDRVRVTLISSWDYTYYSAMFPGVLSGQYTEDETRIALQPLAFSCNTDFILATATRIDPDAQKVYLDDGREIAYDVLSINIGSRTYGTSAVLGIIEHAILTRPMNVFLERVIEHEEVCKKADKVPRLLVIGSGVSGVELICALKTRLMAMFGRDVMATLIDKRPKTVTSSASSFYRRIITQNLDRYKIKVVYNARVKKLPVAGEVELVDGRLIHGDIIIWATGPEPQPLDTGLSLCSRGFIRVTQSLQSVDKPNIFAAGDCITMQGMPINFPPKTGVHAVQEGPVLALNIIAYARAKLFKIPLSLMLYEPTSDVLQLVNFGDGRGLATKYSMTFSGKWPFQLKNDNDRKLMAKFAPDQVLGPTGLQKYYETKNMPNARELVYAAKDPVEEDEWQRFSYDTDSRELDIEEEVRDLSPELAFDLLMESSDTMKRGSSEEYKFQSQIIKRADVDTRFRTDMIRYYKQSLETMPTTVLQPQEEEADTRKEA